MKFEEDVEDGGERWSKPYVATLSLHSLFELRSCILNGTVLLDMRASTLEEIAGISFSPLAYITLMAAADFYYYLFLIILYMCDLWKILMIGI